MSVHELRAESLTIGVNGRVFLRQVDLVVEAGTWLTITGPSGSGKSLLLQALSGLQRPQAGDVFINGSRLYGASGPKPTPGIVLQDYALLPFLTARETVALPLQATSVPAGEIETRVSRWVDAVGLRAAGDQVVSNLSGGQRQRVAIARALALESGVLFLDEPTAELDAANRMSALMILRELVNNGAIIFAISHDQAMWELSDVMMTVTLGGNLAAAQAPSSPV